MQANGINDSGSIVGWFEGSNGVEDGFLYRLGKYTLLNGPQGANAIEIRATGINAAGLVVGWYADSNGIDYGFVYNSINATYYTLPNLPENDDAIDVKATGVNDDGQIVGHYTDGNGNDHSFVYSFSGSNYSHGKYASLPSLPLIDGVVDIQARGINDAGQIVGYYQTNDGNQYGFVYSYSGSDFSGGNYTDILSGPPSSGSVITEAVGINDAGQIAGYYVDGAGNSYAFTSAPLLVVWNNAEGGDFADAANWTPEIVPDADDDVEIALSGRYTVTSTGAVRPNIGPPEAGVFRLFSRWRAGCASVIQQHNRRLLAD